MAFKGQRGDQSKMKHALWVRIHVDLYELIKAEAKASRRPMAEVIRQILYEAFGMR